MPNRLPGGGGGGSVPRLQKSSSDRKATATNRIHSNDLEACVMKGCCFWFHSVVENVHLRIPSVIVKGD